MSLLFYAIYCLKKANKKHLKKLKRMQVCFNRQNDADLLDKINKDDMHFSTRVRLLLREFYGLPKKKGE